jgi:transposase
MRKIKELLRLRFECGLSTRPIAASLAISVGSVHEYLSRARVANLSWPLPDGLTEDDLEALLFPAPTGPASPGAAVLGKPLPDWKYVEQELKRKGVTLRLLWEEHRASHPDGLAYSQFCKRFADYRRTIDPRMRQSHKAGEKLFVDYAGLTLGITDPTTGEVRQAPVFVATWGASSYTYAEATASQGLPDWIGSHLRAFSFFGGAPELLVCDNLKSGVTAACFYDPDLQRTYAEMAAHYGCAILPARVRKPRDKAKVEAGVQGIEERILAPLRDQTFFSLQAANCAIALLLEAFNRRPMQGRDHSRADLFGNVDAPALRSLPEQPYQLGYWSRARVHIDYHIACDDRYYSVPYTLVRQQVDVRQSGQTVEVFKKGERVASHARVPQKYGRSTYREHMPATHQEYAGWSPERLLDWAGRCGPHTRQVAEAILAAGAHPQLGFRSGLGLIRLSRMNGAARTEAACKRALDIGAPTYRCVKTILANRAEADLPQQTETRREPVRHDNIRGADYYRSEA